MNDLYIDHAFQPGPPPHVGDVFYMWIGYWDIFVVWQIYEYDGVDQTIVLRRMKKNGMLGMQQWIKAENWPKADRLFHPLYAFRHLFSIADIERAIPLVPFLPEARDGRVVVSNRFAYAPVPLNWYVYLRLIKRAKKEAERKSK